MTDQDAHGRSDGGAQGHLTRADLLRRAAAGGAVILGSSAIGESALAGVNALDAALPKRGGTFRLGVSGGSTKDFIDGQNIVNRPDQARIVTGWETLVGFDSKFRLAFNGLGGVQAVGFPVSQRMQWDGFTVQAFQRVVFQWRPESKSVAFVNVFDRLHELGKDDFSKIPNGAPGVETRLTLVHNGGVRQGRISLNRFVEVLPEESSA